ncbi:MAG: LLM class flavin-dependent oxidoreductase, partial [Thermoplasmata archaeon]
QEGGPPIWVGSRGDRALRLAARWADGVNVAAFPTPEEYRERMEALQRFAEEEGRDFALLGKSHFMWALIGEPPQVDDMVRSFAQTLGAPEDRIRAVGGRGYLGEPEGAVAAFERFVEAGAQHLILNFAKGWERRSMELVHDHVMSQLP